jgi:hypothetical protein
MSETMRQVINNWNPIEIYPLLENEYQYEIKRIREGIAISNSSIQSLSNLVYTVFKDSFGEQFQKTIEDCREIACKLREVDG